MAKIRNSGESDKPGKGGRCLMSSQRRSKLRPLLVSLPLVFSIGTLAGQAFAQRMPEAAKGPSVAWRAGPSRQAERLCRLGDVRGLPSRGSPSVCEDPSRTCGRETANFPFRSHAGNFPLGCGGEEDL